RQPTAPARTVEEGAANRSTTRTDAPASRSSPASCRPTGPPPTTTTSTDFFCSVTILSVTQRFVAAYCVDGGRLEGAQEAADPRHDRDRRLGALRGARLRRGHGQPGGAGCGRVRADGLQLLPDQGAPGLRRGRRGRRV